MTIGQNRIIHRFVRPIEDYEQGGTYYNQIIPLDTQAYAYYSDESGEDSSLWYVFGDGIHTYMEIKQGKGKTQNSKEFPVFTEEFIEAIISIHSFEIKIVQQLPDIGESNVLYLVPKSTTNTIDSNEPVIKNDYNEYIWLSTYYEFIGGTGQSEVTFASLIGQPTDNVNLATALNAKQDIILDLSAIRTGANLGSTALQQSNYDNPALTSENNICTWSLTISKDPSQIIVIEKETGKEIIVDIIYDTKSATIKLNSNTNIVAGVYTARVFY